MAKAMSAGSFSNNTSLKTWRNRRQKMDHEITIDEPSKNKSLTIQCHKNFVSWKKITHGSITCRIIP